MLKPIVLIAAVVAIVVCAIIFVWLRSSSPTARGGKSSNADAPGDRDQQTLGRLKELGSDLTKPHEIEFFLYFPDEQRARAAAADIGGDFAVEVDPAADDGGRWLIVARRTMVPMHEAILAIRQRLEALAAEGDGEFDGWGAEVVP
jgi:hypothetical protein